MTKRSLKGTKITALSGFTRSLVSSIWDEDATPDSAKDNPIAMSLFKDLIDDVTSRFLKAVVELAAPTTDFVAFDTSDAITNIGSIYTVNRTFYAYINGTFYKVNTGSDTEVGTILLELSSTEDGMYQTLDIGDGVSGSGVIDVTNILWLKDIFSFDLTNERLRVKDIVDEDDTGAPNFSKGLTGDLTGDVTGDLSGATVVATTSVTTYQMNADRWSDEAGTGAPLLPSGVQIGSITSTLNIYEEGTFTPNLRFGTGTTGITYSTQKGRYIRTGDDVSIWIWIVLTSKGTSTGNANINDFPYSADTDYSDQTPWQIAGDGVTQTDRLLAAFYPSANRLDFHHIDTAGTRTAVEDTDFSGTDQLYIFGKYKALV